MTPLTASDNNPHTGQSSATVWRKSSRSIAGGECVEVAVTMRQVLVRDSQDPRGVSLAFDCGAWRAFIRALAANDLTGPEVAPARR